MDCNGYTSDARPVRQPTHTCACGGATASFATITGGGEGGNSSSASAACLAKVSGESAVKSTTASGERVWRTEWGVWSAVGLWLARDAGGARTEVRSGVVQLAVSCGCVFWEV